MRDRSKNDLGFIDLDEDDYEAEGKDLFGFISLDPEESIEKNNISPISEIEQPSNDKKEKLNLWQRLGSNPLTQIALGLAKKVTYPLDILKMAMVGEGLSEIDEIEEAFTKAGKSFDREEYIRKVFGASETIPTQQMAEDWLKEKTGIDLSPKDTFSKILRNSSEIVATGPKGLLKESSQEIAKKLSGALATSTGGEGLKKMGLPEPVADAAAFVTAGALTGKKTTVQLNKEGQQLREIAEKHGLRKFRGLEKELPPSNPVVSAKLQEQASKDLSETSLKAINQIISEKIPIKKLRDSGINLEEAYHTAYSIAHSTAQSLDNQPVNITNILDFIKKKIKTIEASAPSLSPSDKAVIKELNKQYKSLTKSGSESIGSKKILNRQPKEVSSEQLLNQYKNFNEEVKGIYKKPEFSGSEGAVKDIYKELNSELIKSLEKFHPSLAQELLAANRLFSETSKLSQVEGILHKAFEHGYDSIKLQKVLGGKANRSFLERSLGKGSVQDLKDISQYGKQAQDKIFSILKNPKTLGQLATELTPLKAALLFLKSGSILPALGYELPKALKNRAQGWLFLHPSTRKTYVDFLKHAVSPFSPAFKKASSSLTKAIEKEFDSEQEFLRWIENE